MITTACSSKQTPAAAADELVKQLASQDVKLIVYFASSIYDQKQLHDFMKFAFSEAEIIGCTTSGEIGCGKMMKNSVVAMAVSADLINDIKVEVLENISSDPSVKSAFSGFEAHFGKPMSTMAFEKYVGIILIDGMSGAEERVMDSVGDLTNIQFIGGSAGDDLKFKQTFVFANGKVYSNAAVLVLIDFKNGFDIIKTQSFSARPKKLTATKIDAKNREVQEFDHEPATTAYAKALGVVPEKLPEYFMSNPVGVIADKADIYVRSPREVNGSSVRFYCNIPEGLVVNVLDTADIIADTKKAVDQKLQALGQISGLINFNCILRTLQLEQSGKSDEYGRLFEEIPTIGLSTYGEQYVGHINQTATMLVIK